MAGEDGIEFYDTFGIGELDAAHEGAVETALTLINSRISSCSITVPDLDHHQLLSLLIIFLGGLLKGIHTSATSSSTGSQVFISTNCNSRRRGTPDCPSVMSDLICSPVT